MPSLRWRAGGCEVLEHQGLEACLVDIADKVEGIVSCIAEHTANHINNSLTVGGLEVVNTDHLLGRSAVEACHEVFREDEVGHVLLVGELCDKAVATCIELVLAQAETCEVAVDHLHEVSSGPWELHYR